MRTACVTLDARTLERLKRNRDGKKKGSPSFSCRIYILILTFSKEKKKQRMSKSVVSLPFIYSLSDSHIKKKWEERRKKEKKREKSGNKKKKKQNKHIYRAGTITNWKAVSILFLSARQLSWRWRPFFCFIVELKLFKYLYMLYMYVLIN